MNMSLEATQSTVKVKPSPTMFTILLIILATMTIASAMGQQQTSNSHWQLTDIQGQKHALFVDRQVQATILMFVSTDCPIANGYQPTIKKLTQEFPAPKFCWYLIHVNPELSADAARLHAKQFGVEVPVIIDNGLEIARRVGATKIPEMFVFADSAERPIYQGRVDNLFVGFGKKRVAPTSYDLQNVLQAVRDKAPVSFSRTEVVGCSIAFQDGQSADQTANSKTIGSAASYDPLQISTDEIETQLFTVEDVSRSREIPIRVYFPKKTEPAPVIVFSHGLGGSRDNAVYVCKHWAARGFVAVVAQHPGSDESVWKGQRPLEILSKMKAAANGENFTLRVKDIPAVIDQLEKWNQETQHPLHNRLNLERIGMTGHSFGAITTQAVSGQSFLGRQQFTDDRIKAALPMSPSAPRAGSSDQSFGKVAIPWLLMTGTKDTSIINDTTVENRLSVYPALPEGGKYELVLHEGAHSAFSERALPGDRGKRNPNHHRAILAISTAFWEAYLNQDSAARNWLDGDAVRGVLEADDRWQRK